MNSKSAVILADGSFPVHEIPSGYLRNAEHIICCDGSATGLLNTGLEPEAIVGDLDSLDPDTAERYSDRLFMDKDQETNDLTKAVRWCASNGFDDIVILGATGKREDHTLGNISLLAEYSSYIKVRMITDTGELIPLTKSGTIPSFPGQQVSVFAVNPFTKVTSEGLKYEMNDLELHNWWRATLNEAKGDSFSLTFREGTLIVFLKFMDSISGGYL
jgi:thiamine pyrophosphokinase